MHSEKKTNWRLTTYPFPSPSIFYWHDTGKGGNTKKKGEMAVTGESRREEEEWQGAVSQTFAGKWKEWNKKDTASQNCIPNPREEIFLHLRLVCRCTSTVFSQIKKPYYFYPPGWKRMENTCPKSTSRVKTVSYIIIKKKKTNCISP